MTVPILSNVLAHTGMAVTALVTLQGAPAAPRLGGEVGEELGVCGWCSGSAGGLVLWVAVRGPGGVFEEQLLHLRGGGLWL